MTTAGGDWGNYWATRRSLLQRLNAVSRLADGAATRLQWKMLGGQLLPDYLSEVEVEAAGADVPHEPKIITSPPAPKVQMRPAALEWAERYQGLYIAFLEDSLKPQEDPEVYWTLHQFNWLLTLVRAKGPGVPADHCRAHMASWVERLGRRPEDPAWRSFSISERLCNWIDILRSIEPGPAPKDVISSIASQALHLSRHLESYRKGADINNHLINNGRGLYVAGAFLGRESLRRLGASILVHEAERQFTADGFLDEGSSDYHLVFTRVYLDVLRAALGCGDTTTLEKLKPPVERMLKALAFFPDHHAPAGWDFPFFGDISPDPPPHLFAGTLRLWELAQEAAQGKSLGSEAFAIPWFAQRSDGRNELAPPRRGWDCRPNSGYYRWDGELTTLWWHARPAGRKRFHSHNDWGGFQLHLEGEPLFIDCGRESYRVGPGAAWDGRATLAQNTVAIDGFEQTPFAKRDLFTSDYLIDGADVRWEGEGEGGLLEMRIHCYERLADPVGHIRSFRWGADGLFIEDRFEAAGRHQAVIAFHLHPEVRCERLEGGRFRLTTPKGRRLTLALAAEGGSFELDESAHCAASYGAGQTTRSIFGRYQIEAGSRLTHAVSWTDQS